MCSELWNMSICGWYFTNSLFLGGCGTIITSLKAVADMKLVFHINHKGVNYADNLGKNMVMKQF